MRRYRVALPGGAVKPCTSTRRTSARDAALVFTRGSPACRWARVWSAARIRAAVVDGLGFLALSCGVAALAHERTKTHRSLRDAEPPGRACGADAPQHAHALGPWPHAQAPEVGRRAVNEYPVGEMLLRYARRWRSSVGAASVRLRAPDERESQPLPRHARGRTASAHQPAAHVVSPRRTSSARGARRQPAAHVVSPRRARASRPARARWCRAGGPG